MEKKFDSRPVVIVTEKVSEEPAIMMAHEFVYMIPLSLFLNIILSMVKLETYMSNIELLMYSFFLMM